MSSVFSLVALLALALSSHSAGQESEAEPTYDLRLNVKVDDPIAASLKVDVKGTLEISSGGSVTTQDVALTRDLRFVDEYTVLEDDRWAATRTYVRWFGTEGGSVVDSELNGVRALFQLKDDSYTVEFVDRSTRTETLNGLLEQAENVGIWFGLPGAVPIGGEFEIDAASLLSLLTDARSELAEASGSLVLRSVDEEGVAVLEGRLSAVEESEDLTQSHEGDCRMKVGIPGGRLLQLEWSGASNMHSKTSGVTLKGSAAFDVELSTKIGPAARKMLARKPVYRDVPRELREEGLAVELPSHWFPISGDGVSLFLTSLHGSETPVAVEFKVMRVAAGSFEEVAEAALSILEKQVGKMAVRSVRSQLGTGKSARFENDGEKFLVEMYPLGKTRLLRLRLFGSPGPFSKELKNWKAIRRTIERAGGK